MSTIDIFERQYKAGMLSLRQCSDDLHGVFQREKDMKDVPPYAAVPAPMSHQGAQPWHYRPLYEHPACTT